MIVLGFDTATAATALGLRLANGETLQARDDPSAGAHPGHATRLLELADSLLVEGDISWAEVERIAVGLGPGRFTGLRVGVATARALARSLAADLVGISSLRALAHGGARAYPDRPLLAVIDARRGEVFAAARGAGGLDELREIDFDAPLRPADLHDAVARAAALTAGAGGCVAVGDGAIRYRGELERSGAEVPPDDSPAHLIAGESVCELGAIAPVSARDEVVPDYRREADAALARAPAGSV
jgi:tRNA threonylcarbamoyladenosine biosynthesis protein TsaB